MKVQKITIESQLKRLKFRYNEFIDDMKIADQAESWLDVFYNVDMNIFEAACKKWHGDKMPTAQDLSKKCWGLQKKQQEITSQHGRERFYRCEHKQAGILCEKWQAGERDADLSRRQFGKVYCYLHEHLEKAARNPDGIEHLWLKQFYPQILANDGRVDVIGVSNDPSGDSKGVKIGTYCDNGTDARVGEEKTILTPFKRVGNY